MTIVPAMPPIEISILIGTFLAASIISVISGSTSLITVPAMLGFGIEPHVAIATNMLGLMLMSIGGTIPFIGKGVIETKRLPFLIVLTLIGSLLGALLLLVVPSQSLPLFISVSMIGIAGLSLVQQEPGLIPTAGKPSQLSSFCGYGVTLILGIYGGFFSGGYVTLLTAAYVILFRMTFIEAIATTKLINIFSSTIATLIFARQGIIDYQLGLVLGLTMFIGGLIGGHLSLKLNNFWLHKIYLTVVVILAVVTFKRSQRQGQAMNMENSLLPFV